jgi:multisubunit Na+/H+ antiporter MnhB subunit
VKNFRRKFIAGFILAIFAFVIWGNTFTVNRFGYPMYNHYVTLAYQETQAENIVTAIYLNYRYYDTLFEAMMLLFSVIAVIYMSVHEGGDPNEPL